MPNTAIVTLGFKADTSDAKLAINQLQQSLKDVQDSAHIKLAFDADLSAASQAAGQISQMLTNSINKNTGKINFTAFNNQIKAAGTSINELSSKLLLAGDSGQAAFTKLVSVISQSEIKLRSVNATLNNVLTTLKNTIKWEASSTFIHGLESTFSQAIGYATSLNKTLTDIRVVTGASIEDMTKFTTQMTNSARQLGSTTKDMAKASLIYYQQGDSAELAAKKAEITTKAANVSFTASAQEMSEMLTAVWNSYKVGEDQLESVADTMAALGATTATSTEEIATAMQRLAATANNVGVSFNQMSSIIATAASVTRQSPEVIGTAWNTMLNRLGSLKMGDTLEDGVNLTKYSKAVESIGVDVLDASGELRNMGDIIEDIGEKWEYLTTTQKTALAQTVGGTRQMTSMMAFFEAYDQYKINLETANNSTGTLNQQNETYLSGYAAAANQTQVALEKLYNTLLDQSTLIDFQKGLAVIVDGIQGVAEGLGGIPGILSTIATLFSTVFSNQIAGKIATVGSSISNFIYDKNIQTKSSGFQGYTEQLGIRFANWKERIGTGMTKQDQIADKQLAQWQAEIANRSNMEISDNTALQEQYSLQEQLLGQKRQLIQESAFLSEAEKQNRLNAIDNLSTQIETINNLRNEYEALKNTVIQLEASDYKNIAKSIATAPGSSMMNKNKERLKTYIPQVDAASKNEAITLANDIWRAQQGNILNSEQQNAFSMLNNELPQTIQNLVQTYQTSLTVQNSFQGLNSEIQSLSSSSLNMNDQMTQAAIYLGQFDQIVEDNQLDMSKYKEQIDQIKIAFEQLNAAYKSGNQADVSKASQDLQARMGKFIEQISSNNESMGETFEKVLHIDPEKVLNPMMVQADKTSKKFLAMSSAMNQAKQTVQTMGSTGVTQMQRFGKKVAELASGLTAAVASLNMMSSLVANFDTSSLTSKLTSSLSVLGSIVSQFASGNWVGGIFASIGAVAGAIVGSIERSQKKLAELREENLKNASEGVSVSEKNTAAFKKEYDAFQELAVKKSNGLDVDNALIEAAENLGLKYDDLINGTGELKTSYEELANAISNATKEQLENNLVQAQTARKAAAEAVEQTQTRSNKTVSISQEQAKERVQEDNQLIRWFDGLLAGTNTNIDTLFSMEPEERQEILESIFGETLSFTNSKGYSLKGNAWGGEFGLSDIPELTGETLLDSFVKNISTLESSSVEEFSKYISESVEQLFDYAGDYILQNAQSKGLNILQDRQIRLAVQGHNNNSYIINRNQRGFAGSDEIYRTILQQGDLTDLIKVDTEGYRGITPDGAKVLSLGLTQDNIKTAGTWVNPTTNEQTSKTVEDLLKEAGLENYIGNSNGFENTNAAYDFLLSEDDIASYKVNRLKDLAKFRNLLQQYGLNMSDELKNVYEQLNTYLTSYDDAVQKYGETDAAVQAAGETLILKSSGLIGDEAKGNYGDFAKQAKSIQDQVDKFVENEFQNYNNKEQIKEQMIKNIFSSILGFDDSIRIFKLVNDAIQSSNKTSQDDQQNQDAFKTAVNNYISQLIEKGLVAREEINEEIVNSIIDAGTLDENGVFTISDSTEINNKIDESKRNTIFSNSESQFNKLIEAQKYIKKNPTQEDMQKLETIYNSLGLDQNFSEFILLEAEDQLKAVKDKLMSVLQDVIDSGDADNSTVIIAKKLLADLQNEIQEKVITSIKNISSSIKNLPTSLEGQEQLLKDYQSIDMTVTMEQLQNQSVSARYTNLIGGLDTYINSLQGEDGTLTDKAVSAGITEDDINNLIQYQRLLQKDLGEWNFSQGIAYGANEIQHLTSLLQDLQKIDVTKLPNAMTKAYSTLDTSLTKINVKMQDFLQMSDVQKIDTWVKAQKRLITNEQIQYYIQKKQYEIMYGFKKSTTLLEARNAGRESEYKEYQAIVSKYDDLKSELAQIDENGITQKMTVISKEVDAIDARLQKSESNLNKLKTTENIFSQSLKDGQIKLEDQAAVDQTWLNKFLEADTLENRVSVYTDLLSTMLSTRKEIDNEKINSLEKGKEILSSYLTLDSTAYDFKSKDGFSAFISEILSKTPELKGALGQIQEAYDNLVKPADWETKSNTDVLNLLIEQLDLTEEEMEQLWLSFKNSAIQNIVEVKSILYNNQKEAAEKTIQVWKNAFETIAAAQLSIIKGESLQKELTDPKALDTLIKNYQDVHKGATSDEAIYKIVSGEIQATDLQLPSILTSEQYAKRFNFFNGKSYIDAITNAYGDFEPLTEEERNGFMESFSNILLDTITNNFSEADIVNKGYKNAEEFYKTLIDMTDQTKNQQAWTAYNELAEKVINSTMRADQFFEAQTRYEQEKTQKEQALNDLQESPEAQLINISELFNKWASPTDTTSAADKITDLRQNTGLTDTQLLELLNPLTGKEPEDYYTDLETLIKNTKAEELAPKIQSAAEEFQSKVVTAATEFADIVKNGVALKDANGKNVYYDSSTKQFVDESEALDENGNIKTNYTQMFYSSATEEERKSADQTLTTAQTTQADLNPNSVFSRQQNEALDTASISLASERFAAIGGLEMANTAQEIEKAITNLDKAFFGCDKNTQKWVDTMKKAKKEGKDTKKANTALTNSTTSLTKNIGRLTDEQFEQYAAILKTNKVIVSGFKSYDDWYEKMTAAREAGRDLGKSLKKEYADDIKEASDGNNDFVDTVKLMNKAIDRMDFSEFGEKADDVKQSFLDMFSENGEILNAFSSFVSTVESLDIDTTALFDAAKIAQSASDFETQVNEILGTTSEDLAAMAQAAGCDLEIFVQFLWKLLASVDPSQYETVAAAVEALANSLHANISVPHFGGSRGGGGGGRTGGTGSSGGGGGGGSKIKHKEYKGDEEIEHYHQINRQIEYQERLLKKVNLLKNQRYGLGYLSALRKENAELLKSIELTRRRAGPEHAGYWLDYYKNILAENGGVFGEITGNLDYQPYMFGRLDDYNRHVDEYNARADAINAGLSSETAEQLNEWFDDYEKGWQKTIDAIDGYEEALDIILDAEVDVMEKLNEISANLKEIATYKMEFRMELNEADMKRIDFLINRYSDYLDLQDESFEQMEKNANFLMENLSYVEESFEELYGYYHTKLQVFDKEAEYIDSLHDVDDLLADDMRLLNDADYVDGLFTTRDALMENVEQLWELRKQMLEVYGNTIDLAADKLSKFTDTLEHHINVYDSYLEILELTQDGIHFDEDIQILQGAYNSALTEVNILREHLDALLGQRETLLKQMENPIYANNEKIQKDFEALQTRIEEIEEQLLETTQTTLDKAKAMFDKTLEHAQYKMRKLGDSFSTDIDWLSTQWDFWIAEQDQYVDRITQVYEIDKLVRDIENAIADTRNKSNQAELKALEDEIQLRSENNALTEYDIEMMRLSYELLLAKQNLENAQDAKDTVRLTRDDNGNYIYQYTADEDKVAEAQQKYNDVLYEMNQTTKERYRELVQNGIDIQREFIDQYTQIMEDMTLSTQEKEQRVQELFEHYGNLLEGIDIQMDNVLRNMGENQLAWTNEMGINLMDTADTAAENISNLTGSTRTQLNILFNDARTDAETWKTAILEIINEVSKSWSNYCSQLTTVQDTSRTTLDDMIKQIIEYGKQANVAQDQASILTKTMDDTLTTLAKMNAEWLVMDTRMQSVIDSMLKMDEKMSEEQREVAGKEYDDWVEPVESTTAETIYAYEPAPAAAPAGGGSTCQTSCGTGCTGSCWKANAGSSSTIYVDSNASSGSASYTTTASANTVQQIYSNVGSAIIGDSVDQYGTVLQSNGVCQECQYTCKNFCTDTCKGDCGGDCTNRCRDTCSTRCQDGCKNGCKGTEIMKAATGGLGNYTGLAWIDGTPERPEYILNAEQTQEMFGILNDHTVSNLLNTMTMATQAMLAGLGLTAGNISTSSLTNTANAQNNTYITAEFPNATDHNEIELALENLMNSTAQSVNSLLS